MIKARTFQPGPERPVKMPGSETVKGLKAGSKAFQ